MSVPGGTSPEEGEREEEMLCSPSLLPGELSAVGEAAVFITSLIWLVAVAVVPFRGVSQNFHFSAFSHPQPVTASDQHHCICSAAVCLVFSAAKC